MASTKTLSPRDMEPKWAAHRLIYLTSSVLAAHLFLQRGSGIPETRPTFAMSNVKTLTTIAVLTVLIGGVLADARADDTSQGISIYVAGRGKYCKETSMSGYLDCFYASVEACQKHNKSTKIRCVANPNSGT
jgi:hypothetical protein